MARGEESSLDRLRLQLRDPLLTLLTLLLVFWMFVLAPLHASAVINTDIIGFILALAVTGALLILSARPGAVTSPCFLPSDFPRQLPGLGCVNHRMSTCFSTRAPGR